MIEAHDRFQVVRDDRVPGGTKQIVLRAMLPELKEKHFLYTASVYGKGGAALAFACAELGYECTLFMARAAFQPEWVQQAQSAGAKIIWTDPLPVAEIEKKAWNHALQKDALCLPQGFDSEAFHRHLVAYARRLPFAPQEIWCPVVSGTMAHALEAAFPEAAMHAVSVVKHHDYRGFGTLYQAPEKFARVAAIPPPYPSWAYSDAKLWRFAKKQGSDGAVIWNSNA